MITRGINKMTDIFIVEMMMYYLMGGVAMFVVTLALFAVMMQVKKVKVLSYALFLYGQ